MDEIIIDTYRWTGPEYSHKTRSNDWVWTVGIVALVGCILAIIFKNYVFAIFILASGFSLIFFSIRPPLEMQFEINQQSITVAGKEYPYKKLKGFKIKSDQQKTILLLEIEQYFLPVLTLPLPPDDTKQVRDNLIKILPELDLQESPSMVFMEKLGF